MKTKRSKRILSCILAAAMLTSTANLLTVSAADSIPMTGAEAKKENQPRFNGYRIWDIRDWTPEADEGSEFLVAKVPLQDRNEAYKPTQVNPDLDSDAEIMLMQGDYGNAFVDGMMYNNTFGYHTLNYWQYVDYFSPWHGAASQDTPPDLHDWNYENTANRGWEKRYFEFGVLNIPNPAYTNAAHKNGVLSVACLYFDQYYRPGQTINELFAMDENGNFPVAEKLIEMAEYFGYDGYFFNAEEAVYSDFLNENRKKKFLARLEEAGLYTQYYDTNSHMNDSKAQWLQSDIDGVSTKIQDSVFINYGWADSITNHLNYMQQNNIDPFTQVFYGIEANGGKFEGGMNPGSGSARYLEQIYEPGTKKLRASLALFTPSDFYQRDIDGSKLQNTNYQWMIAERERMYFSGVKQDPTDTGWKEGFGRPDLGINDASKWVGVADFASERSVINGSVFNTNFSVGKGVQYYVDGAVSSDEEWSNINIQDILPTWQWWIDAEGESKLSADFDYGPKEVRKDNNGNDMTLPYTQVGAYKGGNSLVVYGDIDSQNKLHLFKSDLEVKNTTKASITFKKSSEDDVAMKLGIILKDGTTNMTALDIENSAAKGDWVTSEVDLSAYAGQNIAAIGLVFDGNATGYQMNIGGIQVTDGGNYTPAAPEGFELSRAFTGDEMIVEWTLGDFNTIDRYEIYATKSNGEKSFVGGIFDNIYYIKHLDEQDIISLELVAVGKDGSKSAPATLTYNYNKSVSNIQVENEVKEVVVTDTAVVKGHITQSAEEGALNLSWTNPTENYSHLEIKVTMDDSADTEAWTMNVPKGQTSARIEVPRYNGEMYNASITAVFPDGSKGAPMNITGKVKDTYSAPFVYDGDNIRISGTSFTVWCPQSPDWFKLHISLNGTYLNFSNKFGAFTTPHAIRAGTMMTSTLPATSGIFEVVIEDYTGNFSEPYQAFLQDGTLLPLDTEIDETMVPDAVLRAYIKDNIGSTIADVIGFEGAVDLSGTEVADLTGINLLGKVTELNISDTTISDFTMISKLNNLQVLKANNTPVTALANGMLPASLENLELSGCTALTEVQEGVLSKLTNLKAVDLSNNAALTDLYLDNVKASVANISGCSALTNLVATGSSVKELDITDSTKLVTMMVNNSALEKLTYADASAYTSIYYANLSGNKMDLSAGTPEGIFVNALETYFEENPVEPIPGELTNLALGKTVEPGATIRNANQLFDGRTNYFTASTGELVLKYETEQPIYGWKMMNDTYSNYGFADFEVQYSTDGLTWNTLGEAVVGCTSREVAQNFDEPVMASYIKLIATKAQSRGPDVREFEVYGRLIAPSGVKYDNQKPAAYIDYNDIPETVTILQNGAELLVKDYFDACYTNAKTVRGTLFSSLEGLDWIAADYDISAQIQIPEDITAMIIDGEGNELEDPLVANTTGAYTVEFRNAEGTAVASMTVKVVADKAELNKLIDSCDDLKEESYTSESWASFADVLASAKAMIDDEFVAQSDVDDMFISLFTAKAGLVERAQKGVLASFIEIAEGLDTSNNTPATVAALTEALATAKNVYDNPDATQEEVDAASKALATAITNLLDIVDNTKLVNLIKAAEDTDTSKYTVDSVNALNQALEEAKTVAENKDATEEMITNAYKELAKALANLVVDVNRSALANTIAVAEDILANLDDYRPSTVKNLKKATDDAKAVLNNANATQEEINQAAEDLAAVIAEVRVVAVKVKLVEAVEKAENIDTTQYSEATVRALLSALDQAKAIVDDVEADQDTVDAAERTLNTAINSLQAVSSGNDNKGDNTSSGNNSTNSSSSNNSSSESGKGNTATGDNTLPLFGSVLFLLISAGVVLVLRKKRA